MKAIAEEPVQCRKASVPLTGSEYLESLNDGREVWIYGEKVKDVTKHPAFRNSSRMIARLYDALHDSSKKEVLTIPTDDGGFTHRFYRAPRNAEEQLACRDAIALWARTTYGWMGRSPDYKAAFLGTLGANSDFYAPFADNARRWYAESQEKVLYWNHAIINPPVDRDRPPDEVGDVYMKVEKRPTPASSSRAPRSSPRARPSPTTTSSPITACPSK